MHCLLLHEREEVKKLYEEQGLPIKVIAQRFKVCDATISNIVNEKHGPRKLKKIGGPVKDTDAAVVFEEQVLKDLPDDVLFKHVRPWNFIG